ncbi:hypothetical protein BC628DRAFT_706526 [Trametes gibbosa]|nr:hypothetical protein BC628DRAFT_706526 [Trametes gibbosa]
MVMRMKGHNGSCPCRMCTIRAIQIPDSRNPIHYVPLDCSRHPDIRNGLDSEAVSCYDPANLPLRSHQQFIAQATEVQFATTGVEEERLAKLYGIKGIPLLSALPSLSFPESFPYDFMHLIWENIMKNLMHLWTGEYKSLETGTEDYQIESTVWDAIGEASAASGDTIPYIFGPRPPNVATDRMSWTADTRSFWAQYVGPVLLERRFKQRKYYDHFVLFVKLIRQCLQFEITQDEVEELRIGFIAWVKKYEQFYYQYDPQWLAMCPLTIHALLHISDSILKTGPVWASWAFTIERYCGKLQPAIRSRRFPYASLNRYVLDHARLSQIGLMYGQSVQAELKLRPEHVERGKRVPGYDTCVLLPSHRAYTPDRGIIDKIIGALCTRFDTITPQVLRRALPNTIEEWGKVRILNDGDTIRAAKMDSVMEDKRDATFVQVIRSAHRSKCPLSAPPCHSREEDFTCNIERSNQDLDIHYYTRMGSSDYVDVTTIQCVVGRIKDRGHYAIIDCSGTLSRAIFSEPSEEAE